MFHRFQFFLVFCLLAAPSLAERPNVLLLCVDDLRPELNCFGRSYIQSPHLDALAANGRGFTRHYVQSPTCGASRYALLTGRYGPSSNAALFERAKQMAKTPAAVPASLPAWFRSHGYRTVSVGKVSHHPGGLGGRDWDDEAIHEMPGAWDRHLMPAGAWQHPRGAMHGLANGEVRTDASRMDVFQAAEGEDAIYPDGLITDEALRQLDELTAPGEPPFLLAVGIIRPHLPFGAPAKYLRQYSGVDLPAISHPGKPAGRTTWHGSGEFMKYNRWKRDPRDDSDFATAVRQHYAACVSYADAQVGRVLDHLQATGQAENTIVVLWGDHGWNLGEHAIWGKHCLFEESLRSPLIIRAPGMKLRGDLSSAIVETIDVYPTICDLAGLPIPGFLHGRSLRKLLEDPRAAGHPAISYYGNAKTVRTDRHRLVVHADGFVELYDHAKPDAEAHNLASADPRPEKLITELTEFIGRRLRGEAVMTLASAELPVKSQQPAADTATQSRRLSRKVKPFQWVNKMPASDVPGLHHRTFRSEIAGEDVGYVVLLPEDGGRRGRRLPVVYYLHGGRPGDETKSIRLAEYMVRFRQRENLQPVIYVFVNGGPVSHYNVPDRIGVPGQPDARGADVFIQELIPHIDRRYRTIPVREGRGLEGFSQGGRGTMRLALRHPELFFSVAAGGGGYATEKRISESPDSAESNTLRFGKGDNAWDLARRYVQRGKRPPIQLMIFVGTEGFNYGNNLEYMAFLTELGLPFRSLIVPGVPHSASQIYEQAGLEIMQFHANNFAKVLQEGDGEAGEGTLR